MSTQMSIFSREFLCIIAIEGMAERRNHCLNRIRTQNKGIVKRRAKWYAEMLGTVIEYKSKGLQYEDRREDDWLEEEYCREHLEEF